MTKSDKWLAENDNYLTTALEWLRLSLSRMVPEEKVRQKVFEKSAGGWFSKSNLNKNNPRLLPAPTSLPSEVDVEKAAQALAKAQEMQPPPALVILAQRFGLSQFDQHVLLLCVAMELDTRIAQLCAAAQDDVNRPFPTFALAFALFKEPSWDVLSSQTPLRYYHLIKINHGVQPLTASALSADERIVNYIKGLNQLDDRLLSLMEVMPEPGIEFEKEEEIVASENNLPPSQKQSVDNIMARLQESTDHLHMPVIELLGTDSNSKQIIAQHLAQQLGVSLYQISIDLLPGQITDIETFARLWQRETQLLAIGLYIDMADVNFVNNQTSLTTLQHFLSRSDGLIIFDVCETQHYRGRSRISVDVAKPTSAEQEVIWNSVLTQLANGEAGRLAAQFSLSPGEINRISHDVLLNEDERQIENTTLAERCWQTCLLATRPHLDQLAQRIDAKATWNDIVVPSEERNMLKQIVAQVGARNRVYNQWGFRDKMNRGLGICALFTGESGTGKTMAAEVIANELKLNLYRIDLSSVVNKYIGETEKNLRKLFDAAEDSGAILFFDEADALFSRRIKDETGGTGHYANIEINYLLQRMESYRGLAILTTNMKNAMDKAFIRRLRFIVNFEFPNTEHRQQIWRTVFPNQTPLDSNIDYQRLAKLNLTGGSIHNIALNAAFIAAQQDTSVSMPMLFNAARTEFKKLERPTTESDFRWQQPKEVVA